MEFLWYANPCLSNTIYPFLCLKQVSISSLAQFSDDNIPLTPTKGEPDDLGDEEVLEDSEEVPEGLAMDPMLLAIGEDKDDIMT